MTSPFVPTYRQFPTADAHNLEKQLVNMYTQLSIAINQKDIGSYDLTIIPNGQRWFASQNTKLRDGNRLVVQVSDSTLSVAHNITMINQVTRLYGTFQDASGNWRPLPYVDLTSVSNQIAIKTNSTNIVVTKGAGAPPSISNGIVVLEWL
jgi:hypothetical protein